MIDKKKYLIIKSADNSFERFYNQQMQKYGIDVLKFDMEQWKCDGCGFLFKWLKRMQHVIKSRIWETIRKYEVIILFECHGFIPVLYGVKRRKTRIILWEWNTMNNINTSWQKRFLIKNMCERWSFDESEALKYRWALNTQFYFKNISFEQGEAKFSAKKRAFFVGLDKGRYRYLKQIERILNSKGITTDFWMVKDKSAIYQMDDKWLHDEVLSYEQVLSHIRSADIIIDLVKEGQRGFTVRVMEAVFFGKKLITNNERIRYTDIYKKEDVFIMGADELDDLDSFLAGDYLPIEQSVLDKYDFLSWLNRFG